MLQYVPMQSTESKIVISLLIAAITASGADNTVAIRFRKLWDGQRIVDRALVIVKGDRISSVTGGDPQPPAGAAVIDWSRYYGLPGLIDVHTHMTYYWDGHTGTLPRSQSRMPAETVFLAQANARKTLETGVTAVRDLGSSDYTDIAMRNLINMGAMVGPRMFVCGYGLTLSRAPRPGSSGFDSPGSADTPDEVIKAVRRQISAGADVIKMYGSAGGFENVGTQQTYTFEEMKAAADTAHAMGKKIAIHSYGPEGGRDAVRAGADSLEHAVDLDEATLAAMAKQGTYYVPTIDHNRYYIDAADQYQFRPGSTEALSAYIKRNFATAERAYKAGVKFAMGSDAVYTMFGQNTRELAWFVKLGMTPEKALETATANAADLLGQSADIGAATPGHFADLIAVEGDPLIDINAVIAHLHAVMKGGQIVVQK